MTNEPPKTCVVFYSTLFSFAWPAEEPPDAAPPWGEDCAAFMAQRLRSFNAVTRVDDPYEESDEGGWSMELVVDRERYELFVHALPIGQAEVNHWAIRIRPLAGMFRWLFSQPLCHYDDVLRMIANILETTEGVRDVTWMTPDEFSKVY